MNKRKDDKETQLRRILLTPGFYGLSGAWTGAWPFMAVANHFSEDTAPVLAAKFATGVSAIPLVPTCAVIGFVSGIAALPIKLIGYACEKLSDRISGTCGEMPNLSFDRLVCENAEN